MTIPSINLADATTLARNAVNSDAAKHAPLMAGVALVGLALLGAKHALQSGMNASKAVQPPAIGDDTFYDAVESLDPPGMKLGDAEAVGTNARGLEPPAPNGSIKRVKFHSDVQVHNLPPKAKLGPWARMVQAFSQTRAALAKGLQAIRCCLPKMPNRGTAQVPRTPQVQINQPRVSKEQALLAVSNMVGGKMQQLRDATNKLKSLQSDFGPGTLTPTINLVKTALGQVREVKRLARLADRVDTVDARRALIVAMADLDAATKIAVDTTDILWAGSPSQAAQQLLARPTVAAPAAVDPQLQQLRARLNAI